MNIKTVLTIVGLASLAACNTPASTGGGSSGTSSTSGTSGTTPAVITADATSFEECVSVGGSILEGSPRVCTIGEEAFIEGADSVSQTNETTTDDTATILTYEIGPEVVPCSGVGPGECMIINGQVSHDHIEGFTHVPGQTSVIEVERTQRCDPAIINSCPQDVSIYRYRLVRVISQS